MRSAVGRAPCRNPATRILCLARTMRSPSLAPERGRRGRSRSGQPPERAQREPIRAAGASAGWQHVKIRRRRSSATEDMGIGSLGSGSPRVASWYAASCLGPRLASRRNRSIALFRAVVERPPGWAGSRRRASAEGTEQRLLERLLGQVPVARGPDERRQHLAGLLSGQALHHGRHIRQRRRPVQDAEAFIQAGGSKSMTGRTSTTAAPLAFDGIKAANSRARSRPAHPGWCR